VPPRSDLALPIDDTVMSSFWPGLAKAGSSAVIITTAAFLRPGATPEGSCSPKREVTPFIDWTVYSRLSSPVPGRPTTTPYPVSWLVRMPWKLPRSFTRWACAGVAAASARAASAMKRRIMGLAPALRRG
jgi:hypothetical protein